MEMEMEMETSQSDQELGMGRPSLYKNMGSYEGGGSGHWC